MANAVTGNKIYLDATGAVTTSRKKVAYIVFTPDASNDQLILRETSGGANCISVRGATAKDTMVLDFSARPIVFNNGIYVQTLTSGATATLITTESGD